MTRYHCPGCRTEFEASPLRVTCPECGDRLESVREDDGAAAPAGDDAEGADDPTAG